MLFVCAVTYLGGCADSIREYTTSFQGWTGRKADSHVLSGAPDRDAAAYQASGDMLTEADWSVRFANLAVAYLRGGFVTDALAAATLVVEDGDDLSKELAAQVDDLIEYFEEEDRELVIDG